MWDPVANLINTLAYTMGNVPVGTVNTRPKL